MQLSEASHLALVERLLADCVNEYTEYSDYAELATVEAEKAIFISDQAYWVREAQYAKARRDEWLLHVEALKALMAKYAALTLGKPIVSQPAKPQKLASVEIVGGQKVGRCHKCKQAFSYELYGRNCPHCTPQGVN